MKRANRAEMLQGMDPQKPFYLAVSIGNLDGSREDFEGQGVEGEFESEAEAVAELRDLNETYPTLDGYVYRCVPVAHVWRGKIRVTKIRGEA